MQTLLYLDSARMGLICERARLAQFDFLQLAEHEGCSLYFERFFRQGFHRWSARLRQQFQRLSDWGGIAELKNSLQRILPPTKSSSVLFANRTAQLIRFASRMLAERCKRVLVTDLIWPSYRRILEQQRIRDQFGITTVSIRREILNGEMNWNDVVRRLVERYEHMNCDGLLLPAVSHDGIRLPVDSICKTIAEVKKPKVAIVDGAQAFCHVPDQLGLDHCDLFITGCHKWLRGHVPMGIAIAPNNGQAIDSTVDRMLLLGEIDDPLLAFTRQLETNSLQMFSETVNLAPLFSCRAAIADREMNDITVEQQFAQRKQNAETLIDAMRGTGWHALRLSQEFRTGILLLQVNDNNLRQVAPDKMREFFLTHGISVTCYEEGVVRLSMPDNPWRQDEFDLLHGSISDFGLGKSSPLAF